MYRTMHIVVLVTVLYSFSHSQAQNIPITFKSEPKGESTDLRGNTRILLCSANGEPSPVYRWMKNSQYITTSNITETSLKLQSIQQTDSGVYQCVASNEYGSLLSSKATVNVAYMQPFGNTGSSLELVVEEGKACVIDMPSIESYPVPTVQWFEVNEFSPYSLARESAKYQVTLTNQLVVLDTTQNSDNGKKFRASAKNLLIQQSSDSQPFLLRVIPPSAAATPASAPSLEIVIPPTSTTVVQGSEISALLECVANARPLNYVSIRWYKLGEANGSPRTSIEQDNIKFLLSTYGRVLTINNPIESDAGVYQCEAIFTQPSGLRVTAEATATLSVYVKPNFLVVPSSVVNRDVKTTFSLHCEALGIPAPVIQWYRNAQRILNNERYVVSDNGSLTIYNSDVSDSGIFQCFVKNEAGEIYYATWVRVMSFKPEITEAPQNQSAVAGEGARLVCHSSGAPKPVVCWFKVSKNNQSNVELQASEGRVRIESEDLVFQTTEKADDGMYICNVSNSLGSVTARAYLSITARTRIIHPPQNASVVKGSTALLQCGVDSDESVTVKWKWVFLSSSVGSNSTLEVLPSDTRQSIQSSGGLQIFSVRNSDIGTYSCVVTSTSGNDTAMASITVVELPYPPSIQLVSLSEGIPTSVEVTWLPGFNGKSPILYYIIQSRMMMQNSTKQPDVWRTAVANVPSDRMKAVVADLLPSKSYQFRISAVNAIGEGDSSLPSGVIEIPDQPPSGPPRGIVGSPRSNSSVILMWEPPDILKWNGDILGYIIQYRLSRYPDSTAHRENISAAAAPSGSYTHEIGGLIVFQEYEISLAAYNRKGVGVFSDPVYTRTMEGKPTASPRNVLVKAVSPTSVNISWLPPDSQYINGINQGYHVNAYQISESDTGNIKPVVITVPSNISNLLDVQNMVLTGLRKYTRYSIVIACFTSQGDGPGSAAVDVQTLEDVPETVTSLSFESVMDTSLVVVWLPPKLINGILLGYNVTFGESKGSKSNTVIVEANVTNHTITGLMASTVYTVSVAAFTRVGQGPPMSADIQSGVTPELPEAPTGLSITNIAATSANIRFQPGFDGYTSISLWIVEGQTDTDPGSAWSEVYRIRAPVAREITVQGLTPYRSYRLRIMAENAAGRSEPSEPTRWFDTLPTLPSSSPSGVIVRAINETSLRVQWTPLLDFQWNGAGRLYSVQWKRSSDSVFAFVQSVADQFAAYCDIGKLSAWVDYDVRVAAVNDVGSSEYSAVVKQKTRESVPSRGPSNVTVSAVTSTSIVVSWNSIEETYRNGKILGYRIAYREQTSSSSNGRVVTVEGGLNVTVVDITDLRKFVYYEVQVLGYTSVGDGLLSNPPVVVRTHEDLPGPPRMVYFPEVTETSATLVWDVPAEPNGIITGYRVAYRPSSDTPTSSLKNDTLDASARRSIATGLLSNTYYKFSVAAGTRLGWGEAMVLDVYTVLYRQAPDPPSKPNIGGSQKGSRWIVIYWVPGADGHGPIRNYTIQWQESSGASRVKRQTSGEFIDVDGYIPASLTVYNVTGLTPDRGYRFRVASWNDVGRSQYGPPSDEVRTQPAPPDEPPSNLTIRPLTSTSARVLWQPADAATWNGALTGHVIQYREINAADWRSITVGWPNSTYVIDGLQLSHTYDLQASSVNSQGQSLFGPLLQFYMEIAPTGPVLLVRVSNTTAHEITVTWEPPALEDRNGDILGYRIYWDSESRVLPPSLKSYTIMQLQPYSEYTISLLAYNAAGDGPNISIPVKAWTQESTPTAPINFTLIVVSTTEVNASWALPASPNGRIQMYEVAYKQGSLVDGISQSVNVQISPNVTFCVTSSLIEGMRYTFSVRARTAIDWGPAASADVTVGPQPGTPGPPGQPVCVLGEVSVYLSWLAGSTGNAPISGYIVQLKAQDETVWQTTLTTKTPETSADVRIISVKPSVDYQFRVIGVNRFGVGQPSVPSVIVHTADVLASLDKPFYQKWWFLVIIALASIIIILFVIFILCFTGKRYRAAERDKRLAKTIVRLNEVAGFGSDEPPTPPRSGDSSTPVFPAPSYYDSSRSWQRPPQESLRQSSRSTRLPSHGAASRTSTLTAPRMPPRPSPGSVNYDDGAVGGFSESDDSKSFAEDSSSLSEKASDVSTMKSETESERPAFPNHYANGNVTNSWRRCHAAAAAGNAEDSELDSSQYAYSLGDRGQVVLNNRAGSRAPLPGFSSFV